jgi:lipoprotein-releasing system ATP-binding protein
LIRNNCFLVKEKKTMIATLRNISKYYEQPGTLVRNQVLNDISFSISEGESVAVTGPSGSGKSTLLNILGTLDYPSSGTVIIDNLTVSDMNPGQLATVRNSRIGFVFQLHHLLPQLTILENVLLPVLPAKDRNKSKASLERAHQLLERVGLKDNHQRRPAQMSVGECQRAAVARALINRPGLLLADEPTGSLDRENALRLGELLTQINRDEKVALMVVTHSPELASRMEKVYRLDLGKLQPAAIL